MARALLVSGALCGLWSAALLAAAGRLLATGGATRLEGAAGGITPRSLQACC